MKVRTFYPKVPKTVRDNRDRKTPLTQNLLRHGDFLIQELPADEQIKKLQASIDKNNKQIKRLIQQKFREPSRASYYEAKILRIEDMVLWKMQKIALHYRKVVTQKKKEQTQKDNLRAEMQAHIANLDKIKPKFNPKSDIVPVKPGNIEDIFGRQKPEIKRVGSTTKLVRKKRFAKK